MIAHFYTTKFSLTAFFFGFLNHSCPVFFYHHILAFSGKKKKFLRYYLCMYPILMQCTHTLTWHYLNLCQPVPHYSRTILFIPKVAAVIQQDIHRTEVSSRLSSFSLLIFLLLSCCGLFPDSEQLSQSKQTNLRNGLLVHSWYDIISIWTFRGNQETELKQGKLRCLRSFRNKERKVALHQYEIHNRNAEREET